MGPTAPRHVGSSQTRARTRVPCIGRRILNHCTTREAPCVTFEPSEWQLQGWAVGLRSELISTSDQFSNASGLIKPQAQFAKCFLPHLNCLDCVEFEQNLIQMFLIRLRLNHQKMLLGCYLMSKRFFKRFPPSQ